MESESQSKNVVDETSYILGGKRQNQQGEEYKDVHQSNLPMASFNFINSIIGSGVIAMVSYNVAVGDTLTKVFIRLSGVGGKSLFAQREFVVGIATLLVTLPLCLYRDIARLAKVSFLSLIFVAFILISILIRLGTLKDVVPRSEGAWDFFDWGVIPAIGIMAFAFMCHHNTFLLYESIKLPDQQKWNKVTHASVLTSLVVSAMFGIAGYATFTKYSQGDLLENYCWTDDLMNIARVLFSATIILTYPLECFVTREVIETLVLCWRGSPAEDSYANCRHYVITISIIASTYFISMSTDCLGVVQELNGILAAIPLAYVLPALSYVKLEEGSLISQRKLPALFLGIFGMLITIIGLVLLLVNLDQHDSCSHGVVMPYCYSNQTLPV